MGKSGKKNKSDTIKALRKRYDAFLEEDKKRKERNEYILGRLEKIRSCTTLVQVRPKVYLKDESEYKGSINNIAISVPNSTYLKPQYENSDNPSILREISKKYILIPKVLSNFPKKVNYYNDRITQGDPGLLPSPTSDKDWKSKYSILEELKKEEKGEEPKSTYDKRSESVDLYENHDCDSKESPEKTYYQNINTDNRDISLSKLKDDTKDLNSETTCNEKETNYIKDDKINSKINQSVNFEASSVLNVGQEEIETEKQRIHQDIISIQDDLQSENCQVEENNPEQVAYNSNKIDETEFKNVSIENCPEDHPQIQVTENNKYLSEEKKFIEIHESQENKVQASSDLSPVVNNENINVENNEEIAISHENTINNQEHLQNENAVRAPNQNEEVEDILKIEPTDVINEHQEYQLEESNLEPVQNVERKITSDVNDEFEAEQKEMFYEETGNTYIPNDSTGYSQDGENFTNQQYGEYYEESQKEQIYPIEVNEHEESTERYDPNYEQQYMNNYEENPNTTQYQTQDYTHTQQLAYDQENNYQEQQNENYQYLAASETDKEADQTYYENVPDNIQYEANVGDQPDLAYSQEGYDAQQEYIIMQEPQAIENIEQQLGVEEGYIQNPTLNEHQDYGDVIEEKSSEIQPDVNVK